MPDELYGFDASTTARIADAVRAIEEAGGRPGPRPFAREYSDTAAVEIVRVTSTTLVNGENPGRVQRVNPSTTPPTYADLNTYDDSWVVGPNGETLTAQLYACRMDGDGNTPVRPRWIIVGSATGGGAAAGVTIRVPTAGAANTLTAAFVDAWTDGTPPTVADSTACWALDVNAGAVTAGHYSDATKLLTHSDGKVVYGVMSGATVTDTLCWSDGTAHVYTFARGRLITRV